MNLSNSIVSSALLSGERRAAWSLSLIYMVRMLGLFIILPVFSLFGDHYTSSTPFLIGFAIGVYGLLQASLQVPFGMLGDRIGRKRVITIGLTLMAIGSVVAALSDSVYGVILGRALQGTGAIASTLMALAADLTRDEQRTKVMASLGASIGFAFILSLVLGPFLLGWFSMDYCCVSLAWHCHTPYSRTESGSLSVQCGHGSQSGDYETTVGQSPTATTKPQYLHVAFDDNSGLFRRAAATPGCWYRQR
jgi:dipeptide/tripeptide permease